MRINELSFVPCNWSRSAYLQETIAMMPPQEMNALLRYDSPEQALLAKQVMEKHKDALSAFTEFDKGTV